MNVFDKFLLFEMSYALMRRFAFIEVPAPMTHASVAGYPLQVAASLVRISVGIENVDDLRADLEAALTVSGP